MREREERRGGKRSPTGKLFLPSANLHPTLAGCNSSLKKTTVSMEILMHEHRVTSRLRDSATSAVPPRHNRNHTTSQMSERQITDKIAATTTAAGWFAIVKDINKEIDKKGQSKDGVSLLSPYHGLRGK